MSGAPIDDRIAIREVLLRYARAVDARDLAVVASCFTPDAHYRGALATGTVADALAALPTAMARYTATRHAITAHTVELAGDEATSTAECTAMHWRPDGTCRTVGLRYRDGLVRTAAGWRIARRDVESLWSRGEESTEG